jgi:hypothetical protein
LIYINPDREIKTPGFSLVDFCGAATIMSAVEDKPHR